MKFRTPLKTAKGLGSAKSGYSHWIMQRMTAVFLIPFVFVFICFLVALLKADSTDSVKTYLANPFFLTSLCFFLTVGLWHGAIGIQVVIEDYIHCELSKLFLVILIKGFSLFLIVLAIISMFNIVYL